MSTRHGVQKMLQTRPDGNQGSGVTYARRETQSLTIKLPTIGKYFSVLFNSRLYHASTPISDTNNSNTTSPDNVRLYAYTESRGTGSLNTVTKHQSYKSNEGVGDLFRAMFPDSDIAHSFACGSDKTAYISKFGLAPYISEQLVADANKDTFVLMFDESLNQTTKTKQLDLHVRYWCEDHVQSTYSGLQFMGHGTAEDLLRHFKVSKQHK